MTPTLKVEIRRLRFGIHVKYSLPHDFKRLFHRAWHAEHSFCEEQLGSGKHQFLCACRYPMHLRCYFTALCYFAHVSHPQNHICSPLLHHCCIIPNTRIILHPLVITWTIQRNSPKHQPSGLSMHQPFGSSKHPCSLFKHHSPTSPKRQPSTSPAHNTTIHYSSLYASTQSLSYLGYYVRSHMC